LFPFGIAGKSGLAVTGVARRGRTSFAFAADRKTFDQFVVDAEIELLRPAHSLDVVLILTLQVHLDRVLAVDREVVANGDPAARSKREILALTIFLRDVQRN